MVKFKYKDTEIKCINMVNSTLVVGINFKNVVDIDITIENQLIEEKIIENTKLQKEIYHQLEKEYQTLKYALGNKFNDYVIRTRLSTNSIHSLN